MAIPLPSQPASNNERQLASRLIERFTATAPVSSITLRQSVLQGHELVFKNGALLDPATDYTVVGSKLVLGSALSISDKLVVHYHYRATH